MQLFTRSTGIFISFVVFAFHLSAQHIDWVTSHGKTMNGYGGIVAELVHDRSGNIYSAGYFSGLSSFGSLTLTSNGSRDIFVCKMDAQTGVPLWVKGFGGSGIDFCFSVSADTAGDIYIAGEMEGTVSFGSQVLTSQGMKDIFIAKLDRSNGNVIWAKNFGSRFVDKGKAVKIDSHDNLFLGGDFSDTLNMGSATLICPSQGPGTHYSFISRIDKSNGNVVWAKQIGTGVCFLNSMAVDDLGNAFIAGYFQTSLTLGSFMLQAPGLLSEYFIAQADASGNFVWAKASSLQKDINLNAICYNKAELYATGYATNASGQWGVVIVKHNAQNGNLLWLNEYYGSVVAITRGMGIAAGNSGQVYCTGEYIGPVTFGPFHLSSSQSDVFVLQLNTSGSITGGLNYGSAQGDGGSAITTDASGIPYFAARVCDTVSIEQHVVTAGAPFQGASASVSFVAKIDQLVTGINRYARNDVNFFTIQPNPCQNQVSIQTRLQEDYELSITDARGISVVYLRNGAEHKTVSLETLPAGVYFVRCTYKNGSTAVRKLVKE